MVTKYIIMAGGNYEHWKKPRHLAIIRGEEIIARTIRLLRENGITDISISTSHPAFRKFGVPILQHNNSYNAKWHKSNGDWLDAFYPTDEPVCYILGDVYFSEDAIKTIVNTGTNDIEMFGSIPPFASNYIKNHIEAFAIKVVDLKHFWKAIDKTRELDTQGKFNRKPIIWELWGVIKKNPLESETGKYIYNYKKINDYTCDIDWEEDILKFEKAIGGNEMVKCEVLEPFTLGRFNELTNIVRRGEDTPGLLNTGDVFTCSNDLADYLLGNNKLNKPFVKVIEVVPVKEPEPKKMAVKKPTRKASKK